ncbi:fungal-specific transcription factor domain-containing protein [Talaromyces proteolyticus]|uniref:Fungal-specific transcription factor domain-containing protein n=1 Tax=Talaromyces proteolyticus TaxID=1131652 RepID=A0AAD4Q1K5_9EURO|nr:fungal-specific transcription factor domain-containing protein [Talaromyces proteolyticus]KAH8705745.1 fungal-specific transcription factor domain-containing protein [Talaromyces proteolyticus]
MQRTGRPKRPRALQACEVCRARKNRCSEDRPCTYCVEHGLECTYSRIHREKRPKPQPISQINHVTSFSSPRFTQGPISSSIDFWSNNESQTLSLHERPVQYLRSTDAGQLQRQGVTPASSAMEENSRSSSVNPPRNTASYVMDTNLHTNNLEFYGSTSSVAFFRHVETLSNSQTTDSSAGPPGLSSAALLHNTGYQPDILHSLPVDSREAEINADRFHFRVARRFLDAYFSNIHHIQPLLDEEVFLTRCEDLWFNRPGKQPLSFVALYYATLSLGSLVMTFENPEIYGADRFAWSRKLFNNALAIVTRLGTTTDVEMVQCFYMMSKVCQHELNPHVAYLYSGQAARTSLAIGINRSSINSDAADPRASTTASKTWWAVYCLDIQTSFALGRPDSLGPDQYHTQYVPTEAPGNASTTPQILHIVPCMVGLSRIMRKVALDLYTQSCEMEQKLHLAKTLDAELENWLEQVPSHLRSQQQSDSDISLKPRRLDSYTKKQSVVLQLRYLNLRMVIHGVFMTDAKITISDEAECLRKCQCLCIQSAEDAIDLIYSTFRVDDYFQTWWYNATYTLFAVSILLAVVFRQLTRTRQELESIYAHIDRAIAVLHAMDDCVVARNAASIIKRTLARAKQMSQPALAPSSSQDGDLNGVLHPPVNLENQTESDNRDTLLQSQEMNGDELGEAVGDLDWISTYPFNDSQQASFWTEWAHEINTLGT